MSGRHLRQMRAFALAMQAPPTNAVLNILVIGIEQETAPSQSSLPIVHA